MGKRKHMRICKVKKEQEERERYKYVSTSAQQLMKEKKREISFMHLVISEGREFTQLIPCKCTGKNSHEAQAEKKEPRKMVILYFF